MRPCQRRVGCVEAHRRAPESVREMVGAHRRAPEPVREMVGAHRRAPESVRANKIQGRPMHSSEYPPLPVRRSIRHEYHDYQGPGAYFLTICTFHRQPILSSIRGGMVTLSRFGAIVEEEWRRTAVLRPSVELDEFVIMPDHLHGIVRVIDGPSLPSQSSARALIRPVRPLGSLVSGFKSACTTRINQLRGTPHTPVWQRNYYERVIRDAGALERARRYIRNNPACWQMRG